MQMNPPLPVPTVERPAFKAAMALARQMRNPTREQVAAWAKLMKAALR
jgi:hypothetical protein